MKISLKKLLVTSASLLMMASVGAGINSTKVSASTMAYYEGPTTHIGSGNARDTWLIHGQRLKVYTHSMLDGNYATAMGWTPENEISFHHHIARHHYHKHARKHYSRPVKKAKKYVVKRHIRKSHKVAKRRVSSKRTMVAERTYFKYEHAVHPKMAVKAINFSNVSWKQINNWNSQIKKVQAKRRNKKARKATVHKSRKNKTSRKVANFRKSAYYHKMWTNALKMNQKQVSHELKEATKYSKDGNMKATKKASQKANYFKRFVKHDQSMINLGK